jgi:hypothetical protein
MEDFGFALWRGKSILASHSPADRLNGFGSVHEVCERRAPTVFRVPMFAEFL